MRSELLGLVVYKPTKQTTSYSNLTSNTGRWQQQATFRNAIKRANFVLRCRSSTTADSSDRTERQSTHQLREHRTWSIRNLTSLTHSQQSPRRRQVSISNTLRHSTVIFIAMGNRTSYCVSLLQALVRCPGSTRSIAFHIIAPSTEVYQWYRELLQSCVESCAASGINLWIYVHQTRKNVSDENNFINSFHDVTTEHFALSRLSTDSQSSDAESTAMINEKIETTDMAIIGDSSSCSSSDEHDKSVPSLPNVVEGSDEEKLLTRDADQHAKVGCRIAGCGTEYTRCMGRPTAKFLLEGHIASSAQSDKVTVVAAVSNAMAASLSRETCRLIAASTRHVHSGDIRLWIEQNG